MKRSLSFLLILMLLCVNVSGDIAIKDVSTISFDGNILYVGGSGPNNYTTIQSAIDDALDGDTVFVYDDNSPYYENIILEKTINLTGENRNTTIIDGNHSGRVIMIYSNDSRIAGFTLQNSGPGIYESGILLKGRRCIVVNNKFINNTNGVYLLRDFGPIIIHSNIFTENYCGIHIDNNDFIITENYIYNNKEFGIWSYSYTTGGNISKNIISNNTNGIYLDYDDNCHIFGNIITNNSNFGISGYFTDYNTIENNIIRDNNNGIFLESSFGNRIIKNNIINNTNQSFFINYRFCFSLELLYNGKDIFLMNYWDDHNSSSPRLIKGKMINEFMVINLILSIRYYYGGAFFGLIEIPTIERVMYYYDLLPASEPYDIEV